MKPGRGNGAVVFDCDGLLLDTEECWSRGEAGLFAAYGRPFGPEDKALLLGSSAERAGEVLSQVLEQPGREADLVAELMEYAWKEVASGAKPRPGSAGLLARLSVERPVGLASNSPKELVLAALRTAGIGAELDVIVCSEEVARPKPDPGVYLAACARLGVDPSEATALEDSPPGVSAARTAGMRVIGVPSMPGMTLEDAHVVFDSLEHPGLWELLALA